jgi:Raf kinase inhibitor-like YbhB/YbcL family protein
VLLQLLACSSGRDEARAGSQAAGTGVAGTGSTSSAAASGGTGMHAGAGAPGMRVVAGSGPAQPGAIGTGGMAAAANDGGVMDAAADGGMPAADGGMPAADGGMPAAQGGMPAAHGGGASSASPDAAAMDAAFVLTPVGFPMAAAELTFPESANPPTNASPELTWSGVPVGSKSLALVFRDLGNGAIKWILWDLPPTLTRVPPNISKVAMPPELPGSRQLGSLDNQGYAGPGSGARQYDFKLWALDVVQLPVTSRLTTAQIHADVLPRHALATSTPVLVRNTRNQ